MTTPCQCSDQIEYLIGMILGLSIILNLQYKDVDLDKRKLAYEGYLTTLQVGDWSTVVKEGFQEAILLTLFEPHEQKIIEQEQDDDAMEKGS